MGLFDSFRRRSDAPEELPYDESASVELDGQAAALVRNSVMRITYHATPDAPSLTIQGPCPRCGHEFSRETTPGEDTHPWPTGLGGVWG